MIAILNVRGSGWAQALLLVAVLLVYLAAYIGFKHPS